MTRRPGTASIWLMLLALGGLLAGHVASYFVVAPDVHERAQLLAQTGHSEHGLFETVAVAATFAALIGIFVQRLRTRREGGDLALPRHRVAAVLWVVQTVGFVALETWERGHGLASVAELVHEPAFLAGLAAQVVVALVAAALVLLVHATAEAIRRLLYAPPYAPLAPVFFGTARHRPRTSVSRAAWNLRGPPSPALH